MTGFVLRRRFEIGRDGDSFENRCPLNKKAGRAQLAETATRGPAVSFYAVAFVQALLASCQRPSAAPVGSRMTFGFERRVRHAAAHVHVRDVPAEHGCVEVFRLRDVGAA